ncbi:MAG: DNA mismatch repair protein MutS [Sphaerochaetaceae bacterium]
MSKSLDTPMMQQYLELKKQYQQEVLFFRLGDFYEMFLEDAIEISALLNITLTNRNGIPMAGIPYHAANNYIKRLLDAGKKVAICEQTEMPSDTRSIAKREVVQVMTPATVVEDEFLDESQAAYILALSVHSENIYCAYSDVSSGFITVVEIEKEEKYHALRSLIEQLHPKELLVHEDHYFSDDEFATVVKESSSLLTRLPGWYFNHSTAYQLFIDHFNSASLKGFGLDESSLSLEPSGALLHYLKQTSFASLKHINRLVVQDRSLNLLIDESTRKNLELLYNTQDGGEQRTLFSSLHKTVTSGGSRLLKMWISTPVSHIPTIEHRQQWVSWFYDDAQERQRIRFLCTGLRDLNRLVARISMNRGNPSDLISVADAIATFFKITEFHKEHYLSLLNNHVGESSMSSLVDLMKQIYDAIDEEVIGIYTPGEVIRSGYSDELDALRDLSDGGVSQLYQYIEELKKESGIQAIKLGQNKIIGHYIEISKTHSQDVPPSFFRKQTLVNAERYTTEKLTLLEGEITSAKEKVYTLERTLYEEVVSFCSSLHQELIHLGSYFSHLDVFQSLAQVAVDEHYVKPLIKEDTHLLIEEGRHPVVEQHISRATFVANDLSMQEGEDRFALITGPNMAGKSTFLRQNALIVLLGHIGSYVPASKAIIPLTDRLYCRVGASDNIARGESTFLVEMQEVAYILNTATNRSFAIIDEIGRGTSTQDGMSIAYAIAKELVKLKVKTLFATHYHELTMLDTSHMQLLTLKVTETRRSIIFHKKVEKGIAGSSYGLHVAKMAQVPAHVLKDAALFQKQHFSDYSLQGNQSQLDLFASEEIAYVEDDSHYKFLVETIAEFDLNDSTPLEALTFIEKLQTLIHQSD